jgi:hypothetical protein
LAIARKGATPAGLKVRLYARVSTHDQQTLPMQLAAMRVYAMRRGWKIAIEEKDVDSGAKTRPKREQLLRAARRNSSLVGSCNQEPKPSRNPAIHYQSRSAPRNHDISLLPVVLLPRIDNSPSAVNATRA